MCNWYNVARSGVNKGDRDVKIILRPLSDFILLKIVSNLKSRNNGKRKMLVIKKNSLFCKL